MVKETYAFGDTIGATSAFGDTIGTTSASTGLAGASPATTSRSGDASDSGNVVAPLAGARFVPAGLAPRFASGFVLARFSPARFVWPICTLVQTSRLKKRSEASTGSDPLEGNLS